MRTGVFFCQTADNRNLNIDSIAKYSANLPEVETVQILRLKPLPDLKFITEQINSIQARKNCYCRRYTGLLQTCLYAGNGNGRR